MADLLLASYRSPLRTAIHFSLQIALVAKYFSDFAFEEPFFHEKLLFFDPLLDACDEKIALNAEPLPW
jgi:hypothetical protein